MNDSMTPGSEFNDPADWNVTSHSPDMARMLDKPEDLLMELLCAAVKRWKGDFPRTRADFEVTVTAICEEVFAEAKEEGIFDTQAEQPCGIGLELLTRVLADIIDAGRPGDRSRMEAEAIDVAAGTGVQQGKSETEIAKFHGVKKATISARAVKAKKRYGLPPSRAMKSEKAVAAYAKVPRPKRRTHGERWEFSGLLKGALHG